VGLARLASVGASPQVHVAVHAEPWASDAYWLHTHGVQKLGRPELDLIGVPAPYETEGRALLGDLIENLARGDQLAAGQEIHLDDLGALVAVAAPTDVDHQAPFGRVRLVDAPEPGEQLGETPVRLLTRWVLQDAKTQADRGDVDAALEMVERALTANPDDCAALALKARFYLKAERPLDAMQVGELMELRVPGDWRGPLMTGLALAALGRDQEAQHALTRAIELNPEDDEALIARARTYERLGLEREAAADRSRAAFLGT
jgi:tetratricopeptide (TPR) repeat protein